jgi:poly(A) polymerase
VTPANLDSAVENRNLHSDGLFKSGLPEELQVFILTHVIWH